MAVSMTGYGNKQIVTEQATITVEIKTVNHRFLDIQMKIPNRLLFLEEKLKKIIQSFFQRGRVEVYIQIDGNTLFSKQVQINWSLIEQYMTQLQELKQRYQLAGDIPITVISAFPDVFSIQEVEEYSDELISTLLAVVTDVCKQVYAMRRVEGQALQSDLQERSETLQQLVDAIKRLRPMVMKEYRERIKHRLELHLNQELSKDDSRIYQEIVLLAEKGDISEEITRINSHIQQFKQTLELDGPIGRKLNFITQELLREVNTIGSKSVNSLISEHTITLKSEIEKIKEQVQNME
ncbi:YicC/YloC family endoribonuclease [Virgibacillus proomii]|uniref:YicC/YloC family endoribonuclease n=1 Tax=Virgibacillus proomii TaxID=84407 RepID=UPI001C11A28F|nr:YicC/YloC family endoribonuclease [Virgibacillus proomii]MBU5266050.1 YicC family protein [Virgibacillus proomii]